MINKFQAEMKQLKTQLELERQKGTQADASVTPDDVR